MTPGGPRKPPHKLRNRSAESPRSLEVIRGKRFQTDPRGGGPPGGHPGVITTSFKMSFVVLLTSFPQQQVETNGQKRSETFGSGT